MPYKDKEKEREHNKEYYQKHKSKLYKISSKWVKSPKGKKYARKYRLKIRYGLTLKEYDKIFEQQGGVCVICKQPQLHKRLAVDHNHKTGKVRGLLCFSCNSIVGHLEKNPGLIINFIRYLIYGEKP